MNILNTANKIKNVLDDKQLKTFKKLLLFSILISIIEIIGISSIMPFLAIVNSPEIIESNKYFNLIYNFLHFDSIENFIIFVGVAVILFYFFRGVVNVLFNYRIFKFTYDINYLLVSKLFHKYMNMFYADFLKQNISSLSKIVISEAAYASQLMQSLIILISELIIVILIFVLFFFVNYYVTLFTVLFFIVSGIIVLKTVSKKIEAKGIERESIQKDFYEIINRSFWNFKFIKLISNITDIENEFKMKSFLYSEINTLTNTLKIIPKYLIELIGFTLVVAIVLIVLIFDKNNFQNVFAILSIFVLGLYRLLPSINKIISSYNLIVFYSKSLDLIDNDLKIDSEKFGNSNITFNKQIELKDVCFNFDGSLNVLDRINLKIDAGSKVAFIGESGSGKSTLVDLIMGLHSPNFGSIFIDNNMLSNDNVVSWRSQFGYIPQSVYLFDGTVADNIVFGREFNKDKIIKVLKQANIFDFLQSKDGLDTFVGEAGVMLSGGQKQRIAIARALYGDPNVLILDEATSALDSETEEKIMDEIYDISKGKTLIIIAHRLSTIKKCDEIYKLENGKIVNE